MTGDVGASGTPVEMPAVPLAPAAGDVVLRTTLAGRILDVEGDARLLLGWEPADLVGVTLMDLAHPDDASRVLAEVSAVGAGAGSRSIPFAARRPNGAPAWVEVTAHRVASSAREPGGLHASLRDATDRRLAELALAEIERRFRAAFEAGSSGVALLGLDGRWLRANERFGRLVGFDAADLAFVDFESVFPEFEFPDVLPAPFEAYRAECERRLRDGRTAHLALSVSLVLRADGEADYALVVLDDVTSMKEAERALEASRRELACAERRNTLGTLVHGLAHEIRTPLTYARTSLDCIERRLQAATAAPLSSRDAAVVAESLASAREALDRLGDAVGSLRRFASEEPRSLETRDLHEAVRDAIELFVAVNCGRHTVETEFGPVPPVSLDRTSLQQVLLHLLANAADAMPEGGRIRVATARASREIVLTVADEGDGIPPEVQPRLFDPLFTTKPGGMGLGLATSRTLVASLGGSIAFETTTGRGTTFSVRLPAG